MSRRTAVRTYHRRELRLWRAGGLRVLVLLAVAAVTLAATGCGDSSGSGGGGGEDVTIAVLNPTTGDAAGNGLFANQGAQLAVDEINRKGGIECMDGAKLKLATYDSRSKTEVALTIAQRAAQEKPAVMVGTVGSAYNLVQAQVAERSRIPYITDGAQALELTEQGYEYVFRTVANANVVARSDLGLIASLKGPKGERVKTVAVMHEDSAYGTSYADTIEKYAPEFDLQVAGQVSYPLDSADLTAVAQRIGRVDADFVIVAGYPADTALGVRALYEQNVRPLGIHGATGAFHPDFAKQLGPIADYVFAEAQVSVEKVPGADPARPQQVADAYKKRYGEDFNAVAGQAYSTPWIVKKALEESCSADPDELVAALRKVEVDGGDGSMLPYTVKFVENGEVAEPTLVEYQWQSGKPVAVWPDSVAQGKPIFPLPADWGE